MGLRKVAVFQTVREAYGFLFCEIGLFIQQAWYWTLLIFAVQVAVVHSSFSGWIADYIGSDQPSLLDNNVIGILVTSQLGYIMLIFILPVTVVAYCFFSIRWQRAILLYEEVPNLVPVLPRKNELRAIGAMALACLAFLLWVTLIPGILIWPTAFTGSIFFTGLALMGWLMLLVYIPRTLLAVPAAATEHDATSLFEALAIGKDNSWRLFTIVTMCVVPLFLVKLHGLRSDLYFMPGRADYPLKFSYLSWYAGIVIDFAVLAVMQGGIAIAYRALVSDDRREQLRAAITTQTDAETATGAKDRALAMTILIAAGLAAAWSVIS